MNLGRNTIGLRVFGYERFLVIDYHTCIYFVSWLVS